MIFRSFFNQFEALLAFFTIGGEPTLQLIDAAAPTCHSSDEFYDFLAMDSGIYVLFEDVPKIYNRSFRLFAFISTILEEWIHYFGSDFASFFLFNKYHLLFDSVYIIIFLLEKANGLYNICYYPQDLIATRLLSSHVVAERVPRLLQYGIDVVHDGAQVVGLDSMRIHQFHDIPGVVLLESAQSDQQLTMLIFGMGQDFSHDEFLLGLSRHILPIQG